MRFFVNDILIRLISDEELKDENRYQVIITRENPSLDSNRFFHHVLVKDPNFEMIDEILHILNVKILRNLYSITIAVDNTIEAKKHIKSKFKIVKAAGGLVRKGSKVLMIYRMKKWDLPKGKINKKEKKKEAAIREVEEECNIKVDLDYKLCATWHTYTMNGKQMLKKTTWYAMTCTDASKMAPQVEEEIEEVKWLRPKDVYLALKNTYRSVIDVFERYNEIEHDLAKKVS